jgi:ribosomal protein S18 acetylase RimI-like enzyme
LKKANPLISIRPYESKDRKGVIEILHKTGYMGEDAKGYFNDKYLFGLLFGLYYIDHEPDSCFVAFDTTTEEIIGYILSSLETKTQARNFQRKMIPRILMRAFLYTSWRYNRSFRVLLYMQKLNQRNPHPPNEEMILSEYPAHLHINVLPEYHRQGIGTDLLNKFEILLVKENIPGVYLWTSERNKKAIPFYQKNGFELLFTSPSGFGIWPSAKDVKSLLFGKKLKNFESNSDK